MDREGMTQRVRDRARQQKKDYDDIMVCTVDCSRFEMFDV